MADFSEEEIKQLRALLLADQRRQWAISTVKAVSIWLAAIAAGYLALKGMAADFLGWAKS